MFFHVGIPECSGGKKTEVDVDRRKCESLLLIHVLRRSRECKGNKSRPGHIPVGYKQFHFFRGVLFLQATRSLEHGLYPSYFQITPSPSHQITVPNLSFCIYSLKLFLFFKCLPLFAFCLCNIIVERNSVLYLLIAVRLEYHLEFFF